MTANVKFVNEPGRNESRQSLIHRWGEINLNADTVGEARTFIAYPGVIPGGGVKGLFEEVAHASFRNRIDHDKAAKERYEGWLAYYKTTTVTDPTTKKKRHPADPDRLLNEAAGQYVSEKVRAYVAALQGVRNIRAAYLAGNVSREDALKLVKRIEERFTNDVTAITGYEESGGGQPVAEDPMPSDMKKYLDTEILGGQIPDSIGGVKEVVDVKAEISAPSGPTIGPAIKTGIK